VKKADYTYVVLDGTLNPVDRSRRTGRSAPGKHKKYGMNPQVIASRGGGILWVSGCAVGSIHDKKAEWI